MKKYDPERVIQRRPLARIVDVATPTLVQDIFDERITDRQRYPGLDCQA
jgi:hypothetical protein